MKHEIDNLGGGNCGPLAFSVGLVSAIQKQYRDKKESPLFQKWVEAGLVGVQLKDILDIDLNQSRQSPQYKKGLFLMLQHSLRTVLVRSMKEDLQKRMAEEALRSKENLTLVESSPVFNKFSEMVHAYSKSSVLPARFSDFNELAFSSEVNALAKKTAQELKPKIQGKSFADQQKIGDTEIKKVFLENVSSKNSSILKATEILSQRPIWLTDLDLSKISEKLDVGLKIQGQPVGVVEDQKPVVEVRNKGNAHWTSIVDLPAAAITAIVNFSVPPVQQYKQHLDDLKKVSKSGLFSKVVDKISLDELDTAQAKQGESDEDFALRLQEAEIRRSGPN